MRTILVNHLLEPPGRVTGITRFLFALLGAMLNVTEDSYVLLTCWEESQLPTALLHSRLRVVTRPFWKSMMPNVTAQNFTLARLMRECGATVEFNANPVGAWSRAWPRVITVHDLYLELMPDAYARRHRFAWNSAFPLALWGASRVITPSGSTRDDLLRGHPASEGKVDVVPEAPAFDSDATTGVAPIAGPYGLIVGNISPNKNAGVVVDALAALSERGFDIPLLHIGRDEGDVLGAAQIRRPLRVPIVSMHGVDDAALRAAYSHARFFLNTSLHEGFCLPVVEAQACGAPVIVSNRSALPEVAGDGAVLVDPTSPTEIADAIARVWSNHDFAVELRKRGDANVGRFSWSRTAGMVSDVLDRATVEWIGRRKARA